MWIMKLKRISLDYNLIFFVSPLGESYINLIGSVLISIQRLCSSEYVFDYSNLLTIFHSQQPLVFINVFSTFSISPSSLSQQVILLSGIILCHIMLQLKWLAILVCLFYTYTIKRSSSGFYWVLKIHFGLLSHIWEARKLWWSLSLHSTKRPSSSSFWVTSFG